MWQNIRTAASWGLVLQLGKEGALSNSLRGILHARSWTAVLVFVVETMYVVLHRLLGPTICLCIRSNAPEWNLPFRLHDKKSEWASVSYQSFIFLVYGKNNGLKIFSYWVISVVSTWSSLLNWICLSFGDWIWDQIEFASHLGMIQRLRTMRTTSAMHFHASIVSACCTPRTKSVLWTSGDEKVLISI